MSTKFENSKLQFWLYYPFAILAVLAVFLYFAGTKLISGKSNSGVAQNVQQAPLDVSLPNAIELLLERYADANENLTELENLLAADVVVYSGYIESGEERSIFKSIVEPNRKVTVYFGFEGECFEFDFTPYASMSEACSERGIDLLEMATAVAELTGLSVNPMQFLALNPELYAIRTIERTTFKGAPVLAAEITHEADSKRISKVFLEESSMRVVGADTNLLSKVDRRYVYKRKVVSEQFPLPKRTVIRSVGEPVWSVSIQKVYWP
ncbi:MAG: hypothetical protein ACON5O_04595 [Lentimonas sp.]